MPWHVCACSKSRPLIVHVASSPYYEGCVLAASNSKFAKSNDAQFIYFESDKAYSDSPLLTGVSLVQAAKEILKTNDK